MNLKKPPKRKRPARKRAPRPESGVDTAHKVYAKFLAKADPVAT